MGSWQWRQFFLALRARSLVLFIGINTPFYPCGQINTSVIRIGWHQPGAVLIGEVSTVQILSATCRSVKLRRPPPVAFSFSSPREATVPVRPGRGAGPRQFPF